MLAIPVLGFFDDFFGVTRAKNSLATKNNFVYFFGALIGKDFRLIKTCEATVLRHLGAWMDVSASDFIGLYLGPGRIQNLLEEIERALKTDSLEQTD